MKYVISRDKKSPAYLQLYQQLREDITGQRFPYNSKLPSKRTLADELGISTVTVEHTYALLCDEGYVESRERSGYFVAFKTADGFVSTAEQKFVHPAIGEAANESGFPYSLLAKTMRKVLSDYGEGILEKSPNSGRMELRTAVSRYLARSRGINATEEQIIIGSGSEHLYTLMIAMLGRGRVFGIESPAYQKIQQVYSAADVRFEQLPLGPDGIQSAALSKTKADVLHITPYRSFPSGVTASASKRHEYLRWAERDGRVLVEDDFESEFSVSKKPEDTLFSSATRDNVIYMNSFSKTVSPSMRMGYMVLPVHLAKTFKTKLGFYSCTVPTFEQLVLAELINSGNFERHINRVRRRKRKELQK